jgi:hypothetical protein
MRYRLLIAAGIVAVTAAVLLSPPPRLVLDNSCTIQGPINRARAGIQGRRFWVGQLRYLDKDLAFAREWPEKFARIGADMDRAIAPAIKDLDASMEDLYREHPELRPTPEVRQAEQLREQATEAEARAIDLDMRRILAERGQELEKLRPLVLREIDAGR